MKTHSFVLALVPEKGDTVSHLTVPALLACYCSSFGHSWLVFYYHISVLDICSVLSSPASHKENVSGIAQSCRMTIQIPAIFRLAVKSIF